MIRSFSAMVVVGLTGGSVGKSTVAAMLAERGAVVVDADHLAREAVAVGTKGSGPWSTASGRMWSPATAGSTAGPSPAWCSTIQRRWPT